MAWMGQERKAELLPGIKAVLAKYSVKASVAVRHHSTLVLNVTAGPLDLIANYNATMAERSIGKIDKPWIAVGHLDVNPYHYGNQFSGECLAFVTELMEAANVGNHDRSDLMSDYHDVGWYVDLNIGGWDAKPYRVLQAVKAAA